MSDQDKLNADVSALADALTGIEGEIAELKKQPAAAAIDFTALDAAIARAKGDAPAPAPAAPAAAPADAPAAPTA